MTATPYNQNQSFIVPDEVQINNQTKDFLDLVGINHMTFQDILFYDYSKPKAQFEDN